MDKLKSYDDTQCVECYNKNWSDHTDEKPFGDRFYCRCYNPEEIEWSDKICHKCSNVKNCCRKCWTIFVGLKCHYCDIIIYSPWEIYQCYLCDDSNVIVCDKCVDDDKLFLCMEHYSENCYCEKHKDLHFETCDACCLIYE